jgi:hypothetical protein
MRSNLNDNQRCGGPLRELASHCIRRRRNSPFLDHFTFFIQFAKVVELIAQIDSNRVL